MSNVDSEVYIERKELQKILVALNNVTSDMKRHVEDLEEFVKENGDLFKTINTANETLSKKVEKMGMTVQQIIDASEIIINEEPRRSNVELIASLSTVTEQLADQIGALD